MNNPKWLSWFRSKSAVTRFTIGSVVFLTLLNVCSIGVELVSQPADLSFYGGLGLIVSSGWVWGYLSFLYITRP